MSTSTIKSQAQIEHAFFTKLIDSDNFVGNVRGFTIHIDRVDNGSINTIQIYGNSKLYFGLIHSQNAVKSRKISWLIACDYIFEEILNENTSYYIDSHYLPD